MKLCRTCNTSKDDSEFSKDSRAKSGLQSICKSCSKEKYRVSRKTQRTLERTRRVRKENRTLLQRYKRFCGCKVCLEKEPACLDLHHVDPSEKEENPSQMVSFSRTRLKKEIRKCVVLCANCHRKVHANIIKIDP